MAEPEKKKISPVNVVIDAVLTIAFFFYMREVMKVHVPSTDPRMIDLWASITSVCMTGVFWLAWQMVKVVYRFQRFEREQANRR